MALHYCSLHQRLFSRRCQRWVCISPATITEIRGYYDLLCSTNRDASFLHVIALSCDHCAASLRTLAQIHTADGGGDDAGREGWRADRYVLTYKRTIPSTGGAACVWRAPRAFSSE